ncbi:MAG: RnfABCDGE type electron transport complex subunit D [Candidatus Izimaplasma sp.]|nr:RnfABCDGE type electron transport complex subunit D [Candidatus Izimaplasma bacterium]
MEQKIPNKVFKTSPHLRRPNANATRMMRDVTIALLPVIAFAIYRFKMNAVYVLLASILSMVLAEYVFYLVQDLLKEKPFKLKNESFTLYNFSAITSGLIYGLTLPDTTPIWTVVISGAVGMFLAKLIFGGMGQNVFNPAAVARVLVVVNFGSLISYGTDAVDAIGGATALQYTANNLFDAQILNYYSLSNLFTGMGIPGSMGEVSALLILVGAIYLGFRTSFEFRIPLIYVGTVFILASFVALFKGIGMWYPVYHVVSGGLLFGAVYMATDPVTSPITLPGRIYFAFGLGFLTFIIRLFGALPEGVVFSILIMNMFVSSLDYYKWSEQRFTKRAIYIFIGVIITSIIITVVGAYYV